MTASHHAACVALGEAGVLIRGPAGSGKSTLALLLAHREGAALVADDRVRIAVRDGMLVAGPHPAVADLVEVRGQGILRAADLGLRMRAEAVLALAVDLVEAAPRLPEPAAEAEIFGLRLPRLVLARDVRAAGLAPMLVCAALRKRAA